jgi:hypothetical protein
VPTDPTAADCRTRYRAAHDSGHRGLAQVKWVVLHSTEGGTAETVARYFSTAYHCLLFGVPPYFVKADGLRRGMRGVTTHAECTRAFGGSHTDPGDGWPRSFFMDRLRAYFEDLREADVRRL